MQITVPKKEEREKVTDKKGERERQTDRHKMPAPETGGGWERGRETWYWWWEGYTGEGWCTFYD